MAKKLKVAVNWAAACGGCDVSLLDIEEPLLELTGIADIVYWPVAMDFKKSDFLALPEGNVDFGLFNGAVRTSDHLEFAQAFRSRCKILVAYGSCACFGGIPGLANLHDRESIFETAYQTTASTENADKIRPQTEYLENGTKLSLPLFFDTVKSLPQSVQTDVLLPGCPPPTERILDLIAAVRRYAESGALPNPGTIIAEAKALCDSCPRGETRSKGRMAVIKRPHEVAADPRECFLNQGILCMGIATRGGCGHTCIRANMPCRGCFGPTDDMLDPGAEALSAISSIAGEANENDVATHEMKKAVWSIRDAVGTFYRFTLPSAFLNRAVKDVPGKE
jgi:F420-non-reducing hydrogenase small subunit